MKYPAGISGPEYAAMEDGYEQGRAASESERRDLMHQLVQAEADLEVLKRQVRTLARVASENDGRVDFDTLMGIAYGDGGGAVQHITEPTAEWPEGSECPVHGRIHNSHGWYVCVPAGDAEVG